MRETLLGVPLGKQFGSQSRPQIMRFYTDSPTIGNQNDISSQNNKMSTRFLINSAADEIF